MDLFIPIKINKDNVFAKGIGNKEMKRIVIGALIGLPVGLLTGFIFAQGIQALLIITVITTAIFAAITYFVVLRTPINLSVYVFIGLLKKHLKEQKFYKYKKLKEWF